jgi:hypothetical protein
MKGLGGSIIAYGILTLAFGAVGLHFPLLWFLDACGPAWAYVFKFAFIALGVWVWRRDRVFAEGDPVDRESRRAWVPVMISLTLIFGIVGYIAVSEIRNVRLDHQLRQTPPTAAWVASPVTLWPTFVLLQKAHFAHHTDMEEGCACLVRLPTGEIAALTAGHLLGPDCGVKPGFVQSRFGELDKRKLATLDAEIASWKLFPPMLEEETVKVAGLYGNAKQWDEHCDEVLLRLMPGKAGYPVTPLDLRLTPVSLTEKLRVITCVRDRNGDVCQIVHDAHRVFAPTFTCVLKTPAELAGCSGAPVVDKDGLLVGIVTGGTMMGMESPSGEVLAFSGHLATELLPVLKTEVARKGVMNLTPLKAVSKIPVTDGNDQRRAVVKDAI